MDIFIAGVGGQGTLFASKILGKYAAETGLDCTLSEVHGMAQRGGSVVTHVRIAEKVFSPVISEGAADVLLAFERLEAMRYAHMLKKEGLIVVNAERIDPMTVTIGAAKYPESCVDTLRKYSREVYELPAAKISAEAGGSKTVNTVMVGYMAAKLRLDLEKLKTAVAAVAPHKFAGDNLKSLLAGYEAGNK
ncbi:indolepyruvate oxidoreductase [Clostridia bacterium]|nr:indolepyruvate oxidoreductase [Clostridia bacterium]